MAEGTKTKYLSCAETAKLVRAALKVEFPGVKFSVRSKTYSGGASITVSWTDGPTTADVTKVTRLYEGASFDGMIDLKSYHRSLLTTDDGGFEEVSFGADYVLTSRRISAEWYGVIGRMIERVTGEKCELAEGGTPGRGAGWNTRYAADVFGGRIVALSGGLNYGMDIAHRYTSSKARVTAALAAKQ